MKVVHSSTYNITIGKGSLQTIEHSRYSAIAILVDEHTKAHCLDIFLEESQINPKLIIEISSGEEHKNISSCEHIWQQLTKAQFDRKSLLINLGGGVIGDMGGFAASCYKRGIDFIQVPTTLLAMVDASVGGKLGIDLENFKNQIGLFKSPKGVYIFPKFLHTLSQRQIVSGYAEIVKHALIADKNYWQLLMKTTIEKINWEENIHHSITLKNDIVESDPFEENKRKILNFGHTLGHAIESYYLKIEKDILHGEAIALGMYLETELSPLHSERKKEIQDYLKSNFNLVECPSLNQLLPFLKNDKKNEHDNINFSLLDDIGSCSYNNEFSIEEIQAIF
ncbi:MAG: 3-dehydroquinate synthase [Flavobacteriales bacterium]|nr:3-dehydroquinate synthase [Flavobacteriales bacterium]